MPTPLFNPAPAFNFWVTLVDDEPPGALGELDELGNVASALLDVANTFITGGFSAVSGLNVEMEIETHVEGGCNDSPHRFFKQARYPNLVLKRGVTGNTDLWDWHRSVVEKPDEPRRKSGTIILLDRGGPTRILTEEGDAAGRNATGGLPGIDRTPVAIWAFSGALPERVTGPELNATSNEMAFESVELSHQGLMRLSLAQIPGFGQLGGAIGGGAVGALSAIRL